MAEDAQKQFAEIIEKHYLEEKENVVLRQAARIVFLRSNENPAVIEVKMGKANIYAKLTVGFFTKELP